MNKLVFLAEDVRRVVEHTIGREQRDMPYTTEKVTVPSVLLVHDEGVYLMSNATERDTQPGSVRSFVAYAEGCHPVKDEDCWENARALVGGDDFGESLPWAEEIKRAIDNGAKRIIVGISDTKLKLEYA